MAWPGKASGRKESGAGAMYIGEVELTQEKAGEIWEIRPGSQVRFKQVVRFRLRRVPP